MTFLKNAKNGHFESAIARSVLNIFSIQFRKRKDRLILAQYVQFETQGSKLDLTFGPGKMAIFGF